MLDLGRITRDDFTPFVGQSFELVLPDGRIPLMLAEVRALGESRLGSARAPFALTFHGQPTLRLPQHIYRLEHAKLGAFEIFLVQISADARVSSFEAIFN